VAPDARATEYFVRSVPVVEDRAVEWIVDRQPGRAGGESPEHSCNGSGGGEQSALFTESYEVA
jgi:hypothetical protein